MKQSIWIDCSDLTSWSGHFTGIQRVVYEYARRFAQDGARFFVYDHANSRHVEISFSLLDHLKAQIANPPLTYRQKIKHLIGRPYYRLSDKQKEKLSPYVAVFNMVVRSILHKLVDRGKERSVFRKYPLAMFDEGDIVVVIGAGWNDAGSLERLCELRSSRGISLVQHINDVLPVYQPHLFADSLPKVFNPYIEKVVQNADIITVISEATKRDTSIFCKERAIPSPTIAVVRLGEDVHSARPEKPADFPLHDGFILSVGTFEIRKNYLLLYQAAKLAQLEGKDFPNIAIVGKKGWLAEDLAHVIKNDPFTKSRILWLTNVSDNGLDWLYKHCAFTVFPSLCEGWGLPIVESLQHGKMCLTSNVSSMLEIGDGMVDRFSPYDVRACMDKILEYSSGKYKKVNATISGNYKTYTWDDSYRDFRAAIGL